MTLQEQFQKDKLTIIAMQALLCDCAEEGLIVLEDSLSGICRQAGISCLDLTPRIREAIRDHGDRLFMGRGDMHLNAAGQALAAEAIGEFISAQGPVR